MILFVAAGLHAEAASVPAPASTPAIEYVLGPKDLVEIKVLELPELNVERRLNDNNTVDLPLLGAVDLGGLTQAQAQVRIETLLRAKYVNRANVSVVVKEYGSKPVSIVGAVYKPGNLNTSGKLDLLQAISQAGGLTDRAGRRVYVIRRGSDGRTTTLQIPVDELFRGGSARWNIPIYASDIVNIPARSTVRVFCLGEVRNPGALEFDSDDRISLLSAIAKAGGLTERASKTIRIKRRGADDKDQEILVDYKRIVSGKSEDPDLRQDDVIFVKTSIL